MNSRQRRKLKALQHNDEIRYVEWLKANAKYDRPRERVMADPRFIDYHNARKGGRSRLQALLFASMCVGFY